MVFSYTPKSDNNSVCHKTVVLVSVINGLNPENLIKNEVIIIQSKLLSNVDYNYYV